MTTFAGLPLSFVNSLTKYPSIETYQPLDGCGRVQDVAPVLPVGKDIIVTEKVDGTNARIVMAADGDWLIGSRNELLTARRDRVVRDADRIVETVLHREIPEFSETGTSRDPDRIFVFYGEVYGHKVGRNGKEYATGETGFMLFDVQTIRLDDAVRMARMDPADVAERRETGFVGRWTHSVGSSGWVPAMGTTMELPTTKAEVRAWLEKYRTTRAGIDVTGRAEGVVVRTADRSWIRKIRFEDYDRT